MQGYNLELDLGVSAFMDSNAYNNCFINIFKELKYNMDVIVYLKNGQVLSLVNVKRIYYENEKELCLCCDNGFKLVRDSNMIEMIKIRME